MKLSILVTAAVLAASSTLAMAQGGPPSPGDARPPGALKQGGIPPAAALRRGDDMTMAPSSNPWMQKQGMADNKTGMKKKKMATKMNKKKMM